MRKPGSTRVTVIIFTIVSMIWAASSVLCANDNLGAAAGTRMVSGDLILDASVGQVAVGISGDLVGGFLGQKAVPRFIPGDTDGNGSVTISDAVLIINYIFGGGSPPKPMEAGDANCSGGLEISDAVYLINYVFGGGPEPEYCR